MNTPTDNAWLDEVLIQLAKEIRHETLALGSNDPNQPVKPVFGTAKATILTHIDTVCREASTVTGETSDGYHTFNELYRFRLLYNAALFNEWAITGKYDVHISLKHSDGEYCFGGGWFVAVAQLPTGQITNHYELKDMPLFSNVDQRERAAEYDGHTPQDVLTRLTQLNPNKDTV